MSCHAYIGPGFASLACYFVSPILLRRRRMPLDEKVCRMLSRCPLCNYSLIGLPDRHKCPECGFSYDKQMEILTLALRKQVFWLVVGAFVFLGQAAFFTWRGGLASIPMLSYAIILFYPVYGFYLWRRRQQDKILLWQDGLQVIRRSKPGPVYSWQDIRAAEQSLIKGYAFLQMRDGDRITLFDRRFFGSHQRTTDFVKRINNRRSESVG